MGHSRLAKIQLGAEATAGTPVAATTIWRGKGWIEDAHTVVFPDENIGVLSGTDRHYVPDSLGKISLESAPLTFEQGPYLCEMGIKAVTPVRDGAGSDYIQAYPFPTTSTNTIKTYTIEGGDDTQMEEVEYCFCPDFEISGKVNEAWQITGNLIGRQVTKSTYTGALAVPSVEEVLFNPTKLYINDVTSAFGTTQIQATLTEASFKITTGWYAFVSANGQIYFTSADFDDDAYNFTLDLTFKHNATGLAEKNKWTAGTARAVRLISEGTSVATPGTTYSKKAFILDVAGKYEKFSALEMSNGTTIVKATLRGRYNATLASAGGITFVHELPALP